MYKYNELQMSSTNQKLSYKVSCKTSLFFQNEFKWKILDNSNYDNYNDGGDFSYVYVIA
jgi:hypothetical protein